MFFNPAYPYTTPHHLYLNILPLSPLFFINRYFYLFYLACDNVYTSLFRLPPAISSFSNSNNFLHNINNYNYTLASLGEPTASLGALVVMPPSSPKLTFTEDDASPEREMALVPWLARPLGVYVYVLKDVIGVANEAIREKERERERRGRLKRERMVGRESKKEKREAGSKRPVVTSGKDQEGLEGGSDAKAVNAAEVAIVKAAKLEPSPEDKTDNTPSSNLQTSEEEETHNESGIKDAHGQNTQGKKAGAAASSSVRRHSRLFSGFSLSAHYDLLLKCM
jgi:hypothetical protein